MPHGNHHTASGRGRRGACGLSASGNRGIAGIPRSRFAAATNGAGNRGTPGIALRDRAPSGRGDIDVQVPGNEDRGDNGEARSRASVRLLVVWQDSAAQTNLCPFGSGSRHIQHSRSDGDNPPVSPLEVHWRVVCASGGIDGTKVAPVTV